MSNKPILSPGPFQSDQLRSGDPYELSNGHPIQCLPTGGRGSRANLYGASVLESDPEVESAGIDTGFSPVPGMLRAPDVAIGNVSDKPGWVKDIPALAVEYADTGQDEAELSAKIEDFLGTGVRYIWVVRLTGTRRVEVHELGKAKHIVYADDQLTAPGILKNPVPVIALYDREAAHDVTFNNLLQRKGYDSLEQVQAEGKAEGEVKGQEKGKIEGIRLSIREILLNNNISMNKSFLKTLEETTDTAILKQWLVRATTAQAIDDVRSG